MKKQINLNQNQLKVIFLKIFNMKTISRLFICFIIVTCMMAFTTYRAKIKSALVELPN